MNKLLFTLSFLISLICFTSQSWALPPCPISGYKHNCFGKNILPNGNIYVGEYQNGKQNGKGIFTWLTKDTIDGNNPGDKYIGEWKSNQTHGKGIYYTPNGDKYIGEWKNKKMNGRGVFYWSNGKVDHGIWKDDKFIPSSKLSSSPNSKIEGYKSFCSEIGFTPGTEKFGECVVEAMKKG